MFVKRTIVMHGQHVDQVPFSSFPPHVLALITFVDSGDAPMLLRLEWYPHRPRDCHEVSKTKQLHGPPQSTPRSFRVREKH